MNVIHKNKEELAAQQQYTPQRWWERYNHKAPDDHTSAIRHAGMLVRAYALEFQGGQVRFCFIKEDQPGCRDLAPRGAAPQEQAASPQEVPVQNEAVQPANPNAPPCASDLRVPKPPAARHDLDNDAFQRWLQRHFAASESFAIPLFETQDLTVRVKHNRVPLRHPDMERFYGHLIDDVRDSSIFCGIVYCMYLLRSGQNVPLYIGMTERFGKIRSISENLNTNESSAFGRWGYSEGYHMGKLAASLRGDGTYQHWVERLFDGSVDLRLRTQVFFGATTWTHYDRCSCGYRVDVTALEACMIRHARKYFPADNLNKNSGGRHCRCP